MVNPVTPEQILGKRVTAVLRSPGELKEGGADLPGITTGFWEEVDYYLELEDRIVLKLGFDRTVEPLQIVEKPNYPSDLIDAGQRYHTIIGQVIEGVFVGVSGIFVRLSSQQYVWTELGPTRCELWLRDANAPALEGLSPRSYWD